MDPPGGPPKIKTFMNICSVMGSDHPMGLMGRRRGPLGLRFVGPLGSMGPPGRMRAPMGPKASLGFGLACMVL